MRQRIKDAFQLQTNACEKLGSPFMARLCALFAERLCAGNSIANSIFNWPEDISPSTAALPLRIAGAMHALVLEHGNETLKRVYPPNEANDDSLWGAISTVLMLYPRHFQKYLSIAPQTNEICRLSALVPGFLTLARKYGMPMVFSELGASAGLNMHWDKYGYQLGDLSWGDRQSAVELVPDWSGASPPNAEITILQRAACDLAPLNPGIKADRLRLLSYIWADQQHRIDMTRAALDIIQLQDESVEQADLADWLPERLGEQKPDTLHVIYHSIVWQYLPEATKAKVTKVILKAGGRATESTPLAWLQMEPDGEEPGAAITLTTWPGGETQLLGRADYHGRWIDWHEAKAI